MFPIPEPLTSAAKSQLETQLNILNSIASTAFASAQKVIALNVSTVRSTVEQGADAARQLLAVRDPKEFMSLSASVQAPSLDKALAYGRELFSIASQTQADLVQAAKEQFGAARAAGEQARTLSLSAPAAAAKAAPLVVEAAKPAADAVAAAAEAAAKAVAAPLDADAEPAPSKPVKAKPAAAAKAVSDAVAALPVSAKSRK